jgi:hypothetical protein
LVKAVVPELEGGRERERKMQTVRGRKGTDRQVTEGNRQTQRPEVQKQKGRHRDTTGARGTGEERNNRSELSGQAKPRDKAGPYCF